MGIKVRKEVFSFKIWRKGDEYGFHIGWFWIALIAVALVWALS